MVDMKLLDFLNRMLYNIEAMERRIKELKQKIEDLKELSSVRSVKSSEIANGWLDLVGANDHFRFFLGEYERFFEIASEYVEEVYRRS